MSPNKKAEASVMDGGGQDNAVASSTGAATLTLFSSSPPPPLDVDSLKNADEIKMAFKQLNEEEVTLCTRLDEPEGRILSISFLSGAC